MLADCGGTPSPSPSSTSFSAQEAFDTYIMNWPPSSVKSQSQSSASPLPAHRPPVVPFDYRLDSPVLEQPAQVTIIRPNNHRTAAVPPEGPSHLGGQLRDDVQVAVPFTSTPCPAKCADVKVAGVQRGRTRMAIKTHAGVVVGPTRDENRLRVEDAVSLSPSSLAPRSLIHHVTVPLYRVPEKKCEDNSG